MFKFGQRSNSTSQLMVKEVLDVVSLTDAQIRYLYVRPLEAIERIGEAETYKNCLNELKFKSSVSDKERQVAVYLLTVIISSSENSSGSPFLKLVGFFREISEKKEVIDWLVPFSGLVLDAIEFISNDGCSSFFGGVVHGYEPVQGVSKNDNVADAKEREEDLNDLLSSFGMVEDIKDDVIKISDEQATKEPEISDEDEDAIESLLKGAQ